MQVYVNQHDFFINRVRKTDTTGDEQLYVATETNTQLPNSSAIDGKRYQIRTLVHLRMSLVYKSCSTRFVPLLVRKLKLYKQSSPIRHS